MPNLQARDNEKANKKSALKYAHDWSVCCVLNIYVVARLGPGFYKRLHIELFACANRATAFEFCVFHAFFCVCAMYETDKKSAPVNVGISRKKIRQCLEQHDRSPWWINNARIADFCGIKPDAKVHNTTILGKYLPRGTTSWERCPGFIQHKSKLIEHTMCIYCINCVWVVFELFFIHVLVVCLL